jgi:hypothetical protein
MVDRLRRRIVPPVAGIPIIHECETGVELAPQPAPIADGVALREAVLIRHRIRHVDTSAMRRLFTVVPGLEYLADGDGNVVVSSDGVDRSGPPLVLDTTRSGFEYVANYARIPDRPVVTQAVELSAYALALSARRSGTLAHGCGLVLPSGRGALCLGVSGAGKSTLARAMLRVPGVRVLNDDRNVLTLEEDGVRVWATPWPGNAGIAGTGFAPLGVVAFIKQTATPQAVHLTPREALPRLLRTLLIPAWNLHDASAELQLIDGLVARTPMVELGYPLSDRMPEWVLDKLTEWSS